MSSKANPVEDGLQRILDTRGFPWIVNQLSNWAVNKEESIRAFSPEDTEDLKMFQKLQVLLNELGMIYK